MYQDWSLRQLVDIASEREVDVEFWWKNQWRKASVTPMFSYNHT